MRITAVERTAGFVHQREDRACAGLINGQACATRDWQFVSGSAVRCPDP
jgi:hypothetical protein